MAPAPGGQWTNRQHVVNLAFVVLGGMPGILRVMLVNHDVHQHLVSLYVDELVNLVNDCDLH